MNEEDTFFMNDPGWLADMFSEGWALFVESMRPLLRDIFMPFFANAILEQVLSGIIGLIIAYEITGICYNLGLISGKREGRRLHWKIRSPLVLVLSILFGWILNRLSLPWKVVLGIAVLLLIINVIAKCIRNRFDF